MSREHSVQQHLGIGAADYDRAIRTFIPGYEEMLSTINWWLSAILPAGGKVIELGGGTGGKLFPTWDRGQRATTRMRRRRRGHRAERRALLPT